MNIRILAFLALAGLFVYQASAQKKCKYEFEKEDPFTGIVSKGTITPVYPVSPASNEFWYIGLNRNGDDYTVIIDLQIDGWLKTSLNEGDSVLFRTEAGDIVSCHASQIVNPVSTKGKIWDNAVRSSLYKCKYAITQQQIEVLAKSPLTHIRMNISSEIFEAELKEKHGKAFLNSAVCIIK